MPPSIRPPEDIERRLEAMAQKTGRTNAFDIREMIVRHLDEMEDYYLAAHVVDPRKVKGRTFTAQEVRQGRWLQRRPHSTS